MNGCANEVSKKSRIERVRNEHIKETMGVKGKPDFIDIIEKKRLQCQKDARGENTITTYGMATRREKKNRTSKKNVDGRSTSSHDNKKFETRSMDKRGGIAFGFRKTASAVIKPD
jgi:hypothetical protein